MKYSYLILLVYLFCPGVICSQNGITLTQKTHYCDSLLKEANKVYHTDPELSLLYTNKVLLHATKHNLELCKAEAWYSVARTEILKGNIEHALKCLRDAVIIFQKNNKKSREAKCYDLMSTAFSKIDKEGEGIFLLIKACDLYREIGDTQGLMSSLTNLANDYSYIGEYEKGLKVLSEAKEYIKPNSMQWFYYYLNAGLINLHKKNYKLARIQFDSSVIISKRHKMLDAQITAITEQASLLALTQKPQEAISYYCTAIEMAKENNLPIEESDALKGIIGCYESINNYKNAFLSQSRLKKLSDSLFTIKKVKNVNDIERRLMLSEKEKTIALQKLSMEEGVRKEETSKKRIAFLIAGAMCLVLGLFFVAFIYIRTRRQKREVEIQKARIERLNILNQKIFSVIAHDFKSPLITLQMLMDLLDKENISQEDLNSYTADVRHQITQSNQILENLLNWARTELNVSHNKNSTANAWNIATEIEKELKFMASKKGVSIRNTLPENSVFQIPSDILRIIIRNLTTNAIKFSYEKSEVIIGLNSEGGMFVSDTGTGITEDKVNELFSGTLKSKLGTNNETGFGLGLYITFELINKFNGTISVKKNNPSGTVFIFTLPKYA
ncbi:tetratricopeptide repeat-containing sensor histidine kinase [Aurantibacillus circumpalustris]|uniref:tetratricopeptide repeat-containing sensor histidine kinase n=1 Tax=Aurantibacillus circumpalustris TaxID=3036359 RepID=UPI00295B0FA8|nr:ATP-binding protein [Aurantibacillus circumpalustris]